LAAEYETRNETQNAQAAGYVLTNSYFSAESYLEHYGVSARVVYLGVDADRFCPASGARSDYVLAVGALIYHKGYRFLVRAIGRLPETIRPRLLIVANSVDPVEQAVVCNLASSLGVNINVQQIWNDIELAEAYRKARAFVYAPMLEPFGLAVLESMACGTPVIAVKEGGPRESVRDGETGILAERDPQSFAGALERILGDDALRQRMGRACVECARTEWTWQRSAEQLEFHMRQAME
jgi:glycosyltransferase involved in cell wall biosynthesis